MDVLEVIARIDRALYDAVVALRHDALTPVMTTASEWWVKSLALPALGVAAELRRRRTPPPTLVLAAVALPIASLTSRALKELFDRARPTIADPTLTALTGLPGDASLPSGHATTAFAAAGIVAALHPGLRAPALALASLVALSRVYLGVHHPVDILAGALLGLLIALVTVVVARRVIPGVVGRTSGGGARHRARIRRWRTTSST